MSKASANSSLVNPGIGKRGARFRKAGNLTWRKQRMAFHVAPRDDVFYPAHVARRDEIDAAFIAKGTPDPLRRTSHEQLDNDAFLCHVQERREEDSPPAEEDVDADRIFSGGFPYQASDVGKFCRRKAESASHHPQGTASALSFVEISTTVTAAAGRRGAGPLLLRGKKRCEIISHHIPLTPIAMREFSQKSRTTRRRPARRRCTSSPRPIWPCGGDPPAGCGR
jgi:hypothetical protein